MPTHRQKRHRRYYYSDDRGLPEATGSDLNHDPVREMRAFDALPMRARVALNYSSYKHFAGEVMGLVHRGLDEKHIVDVIVRTDAQMIQKGQNLGR